MKCSETKQLMSDYLEQYLADPESAQIIDHLAGCEDCRAELRELECALNLMHELPREEPSADLWSEFAPKFAEIREETSSGLLGHVNLYFTCLFDALVEGWAIFISTVRYNWGTKAQRQA